MSEGKVHLVLRRNGVSVRAACGLLDPAHRSTLPAEVTCGGCQKTLAMADREAQLMARSAFKKKLSSRRKARVYDDHN